MAAAHSRAKRPENRPGASSARVAQGPPGLPPGRALAVPLAFTAALAGLSLLPSVRGHERLAWAFWGAAGILGVWHALLLWRARSRGRTLQLLVVPRPQHYLQATVQCSVFLYWGWYFDEVYSSAHLILAQLCFAYAFDLLLAWS